MQSRGRREADRTKRLQKAVIVTVTKMWVKAKKKKT